MFSTTKSFLKLGTTIALAFALTACGNSEDSILNNADLDFVQQNGDSRVVLTTELDTQNVVVSDVVLPIFYKNDPSRQLGEVQITTDAATQKSHMVVTFFLGSALDIPAHVIGSTLPNGTTIPISGVDFSKMMIFDVGSAGSKLYLYHDDVLKKSVIGVAVNVNSLGVGQVANAFARFNFNSVTGIAGIYTGSVAGTSGVSVFADLGSTVFNGAPAQFRSMKLTQDQQRSLYNRLFKLNTSSKKIVIK